MPAVSASTARRSLGDSSLEPRAGPRELGAADLLASPTKLSDRRHDLPRELPGTKLLGLRVRTIASARSASSRRPARDSRTTRSRSSTSYR